MINEFSSYVGLSNLGNTCFMNSALQIIIHCDILTNYILNTNLPGDLFQSYKRLLQDYSNTKNGKSVRPSEVKQTVGMKFPIFSGFGQEDSHEFLINFLDYLEEDFKKNNINIISDLFDCKVTTVIKSIESNEQSEITELVRFLCVPVPAKSDVTLEDCFVKYLEQEQLNWVTPNHKNEQAIKITYIKSFPKYLIFQIKRYNKINKLNISIGTNEKWVSDIFPNNMYYMLKGFVVQHGSMSGGHYISYVKLNNQWFCFNDESVSKINDDTALTNSQNAYLLFYERIDKCKKRIFSYFNENNNNNKRYKLTKRSLS